MLSKIFLDLEETGNGNPFISLNYKKSDDIRDKMVLRFINNLEINSKGCYIFKSFPDRDFYDSSYDQKFRIYPADDVYDMIYSRHDMYKSRVVSAFEMWSLCNENTGYKYYLNIDDEYIVFKGPNGTLKQKIEEGYSCFEISKLVFDNLNELSSRPFPIPIPQE